MKKQIKVATLAVAALACSASFAGAMELNLYGASAQADFWKAAMVPFVQSFGCKNISGAVITSADVKASSATSNKHNFLHGQGCTIPGTTDTVLDMAVSGVASVEALAAAGGASQYNDGGVCTDPYQRMMNTQANTLTCKTVHIGTVDLDAANIKQSSTGNTNGPMGGTVISPSWSGLKVHPTDTTVMAGTTKKATSLVVPFGLFVNSAVTAKTCTTGKLGDLCSTNADCNSFGLSNGVCGAATTISNLSREQVAMLFSGSVLDWSDFGPAYTALPAVACLRHAGSGTAAAFDVTVMSGGYKGWGASVTASEQTDPDAGTVTWFNDTTNTMMGCINGNISATDTVGRAIGAIGYADADKGLPITGIAFGSSRVVGPIKYNGVAPSAANINNGLYDWYAVGSMYVNPTYTVQSALATSLANMTGDVTKIPAAKAPFWTTMGAATFMRTSDTVYPARQ
jgi:fluoride ion exporter CrcB/FEX